MSTDDLKKYLDSRKCFKLICGAGNKNFKEITKLCALYSEAGCRFFDVNASVEAVNAAKEGFKIKKKENECFLCVSVGTKNDPHLTKYKINLTKCNNCGLCKSVCIEKAICNNIIDENICIGCKKCISVCAYNAIESYSKGIDLLKILPEIIEKRIDCIEYHIISENDEEIEEGWEIITKLYKGALSICIDRSKSGNEKLINRLKKMKSKCNNLFMVQTDGNPISGGNDDYNTTLQAVAAADIIEKANITPYIIMSGGTNSKTMDLARLCSLNVTGTAVGSFARKIVKEYIEKEDFLENKIIYENALKIAKQLVNTV